MTIQALRDPSSEYYKHLMRMLSNATAVERQAQASSPHVTVPFFLPDDSTNHLESQFGVRLRCKRGPIRSRNTELVAGMICVLDHALCEHGASGGRSLLMVDGDLCFLASRSLEGRAVERTQSHARLASSYAEEDCALERARLNPKSEMRVGAQLIIDEQLSGGGEHYAPFVRSRGARFDVAIINHFKTPVGVEQVALLVEKRARMAIGAIPYQPDMLYKMSGELECFPGKFYVDKDADMLTLVPRSDATMSISHPYSAWLGFINNNVLKVNGREYLCEKYCKIPGIMYYSLNPVDGEYESPEELRTFYFDSAKAKVSVIKYPKAKLSPDGSPVGFERGEVSIPTSRLERVMGRAMISRSAVVSPAEVYGILMNENNTVINTLDSARVAERVDEMDEHDLSIAIALHVNWQRNASKGTFNTLLAAMRMRHAAVNRSPMGLAILALSAWWNRPSVMASTTEHNELPVTEVADWVGNDFSVLVENAEPWIEVSQTTASSGFSTTYVNTGMPRFTDIPPYGVIEKKVTRSTKTQAPCFVGHGAPAVTVTKPAIEAVVSREVSVSSKEPVLTELKKTLRDKMAAEQMAVNLPVPPRELNLPESNAPTTIPMVAVPLVDPISAIRMDLNDMMGGLPDRDAARTGHDLTHVEEHRATSGCIGVNDAKRGILKGRQIRRPKVDAGVEGPRGQSTAALLGALFKRNVGIPNNQGAVDLDLMPAQTVDRVIETCFKDNWQEIVNKHLESGMWEANVPDITDFLGKVDEKKVKAMLDEVFDEGTVTLDRWHLMAKGKIKPSREAGAEVSVDHSQTILFLESMNTNGMYSSMMRRAKLCIDECLLPNVKLNPQWNAEESEEWYNSMEHERRGGVFGYTVDSTAYDRSQGHPALRVDMEFFRRLGLSRERLLIWEQTHGRKVAMNMMFGVIMWIVLSGVSGLWKTLHRNGLIQLAATVVSADLRRGDIVTIQVKGDDEDIELRRPIRVATAVERMGLLFNIVSKFHTSAVRYFCKDFKVCVGGRWLDVADPWAVVQSVCTPISLDDQTAPSMEDRWQSLRARLRHYDNELVVDVVAHATAIYYQLKRVPFQLTRALSVLASDKRAFMNFYEPPEYIQ